MSKAFRAASLIFIIALLGSIGLNVLLFQKGIGFYTKLQSAQLDPFDVDAFHFDESETAGRTDLPTIVFYGDSRAAAWPAPASRTELNFINRGINGHTSAQLVGRFSRHITILHPDIIILQVGINDLKSIPLFPERQKAIIRACKENIHTVVTLTRAIGVDRVIVTTIFPVTETPVKRRPFWSDDVAVAINEVNAFIRSLADDRISVLDAERILIGTNGLIQPQYSLDFMHINAAGYAALNQELLRVLDKL